MNSELDDDQAVAMLRRAALGLPATQTAHAAAAATAGRRIRRRRRAAGVLGAGTAGLAVIVGVTALGIGTGNGTQIVVQPAGPAAAPATAPLAVGNDEANTAVLLKALGPDWQVAGSDPERGVVAGPSGEVSPKVGGAAAEALPDGYTAYARMMVFDAGGDDSMSLASLCKPFAEKGTVNAGCTEMPLRDGRTAYYAGPGPADGDQGGGPWSSAMYYFGRSDGSFVRIEFAAGTTAKRVSAAQQQKAIDWMARYKPALAAAVADEGVRPKPADTGSTPTAPTITDHDRDLVRMQRALGTSWTLYDGRLALEPNWGDYKRLPALPHGSWDVVGDITTIDRSAFDAACSARPGAAACAKRTVDGHTVYLRSWADRDATTKEFRGESAAYFIRADGRVVLADLELTSTQLEKVRDAGQVDGVREWLTSYDDELATAATDSDVIGSSSAGSAS